jgi:hypothetical protein
MPRFLLEAKSEFHEAISDSLGLREFVGKLALHLFQLLRESGTHARLRIVMAAIIDRVPPKIKVNGAFIGSEPWKTVNPVENVGKIGVQVLHYIGAKRWHEAPRPS